ncbi:hypothetical protein JCM8115_007128 [Rhodotorula mucilaginosa]|uniref:Uncharacterized protein n=1 Tax=Rhodotorula mucilaginosa TaxID=5537 RepID=A0A9P7B3X2_RHOMI|nr:hypothetical protein C6P46_006604 [Rhodotorula mucilaginosa]TKA50784.1 hypothetical protein B0A53_06143 [Rhodotorula sp. CCFEE 5036]
MVLRSLTMVARPILRASASTSATTAAAGDLARLAPHQQIPFSVAPSPKVEGLAQVHLPDMASIEPVYTQATLIPYMPDAYASRSHNSEHDTFPLLKPSEAYSTVASASTHLGGGPSSTASAAA